MQFDAGQLEPAVSDISMHAAIISLFTAVTAPPIADVEVVDGTDSTHVLAYDDDGEVTAELVVWADSDGRIRLDAAWPDGLHLSVVTDADEATVETDDRAEVERRMVELDDALGQVEVAGWVPCAAGAFFAVAACATGHPVICLGEAYVTACHCLPKYIKKFEGAECPGF